MNPQELGVFCDLWLQSWTGNRPAALLSFYTEDAFYRDPARPQGLRGHSELWPYFERLLAKYPDWVWRAQELIPTPAGFVLQWQATVHQSGKPLRFEGIDLVELRENKICRNEVYFDPTPLKP